MKYAYTICSANYLPFAKSVADSLIKHNPEYQFIIFLLDRHRVTDVSFFAPHRIINAEETGVTELPEMNARYNIFELSCAFKPFAAEWIFSNHTDCRALFYFDSDILVFGPLTEAEQLLATRPVLLTPHVTTANEFNGRLNFEKDFLRAGVYNAGFFGLTDTNDTRLFLTWWKKRLKDLCYNDVNSGLFVDQIWLNFVPSIFREAVVLHHPGYNMSYWNIRERSLGASADGYVVNRSFPLVFFHFSGYNIEDDQNMLSRFYPGFTFDDFPELRPLFDEYKSAVHRNNAQDFFILKPLLGTERRKKKKKRFLSNSLEKLFRKSH